MRTPMSLFLRRAPAVVEDDTNSVLLPGVPVALYHFNGNLRDEVSGVSGVDADAVFSSSPVKFGTTSVTLSYPSTNGITVATSKNMPLLRVNNDITISSWIWDTRDGVTGRPLWCYNSTGTKFINVECTRSSGYYGVDLNVYDGSTTKTARIVVANTYYPLNQWNYVTVSASLLSNTAHISVNGTVFTPERIGGDFGLWNETGIWWVQPSAVALNDQFIDELAVTKDVYHSTNFTPPSLPWRLQP